MSEERNAWVRELEQRKQNLYLELVQSPGFLAEFPAALTGAQFVDKLGADLGRTLAPEERQRLAVMIETGMAGRASVLRAIVERQG